MKQEWLTLQNQSDAYEKCSLAIKLLNVVLVSYLLWGLGIGCWAAAPAAILWVQDGIWKTFQNRISNRLLHIEQLMSEPGGATNDVMAMQFNRVWLAQRPSAAGLVKEYILQCCKPTVAYPHVVLIALIVLVGIG